MSIERVPRGVSSITAGMTTLGAREFGSALKPIRSVSKENVVSLITLRGGAVSRNATTPPVGVVRFPSVTDPLDDSLERVGAGERRRDRVMGPPRQPAGDADERIRQQHCSAAETELEARQRLRRLRGYLAGLEEGCGDRPVDVFEVVDAHAARAVTEHRLPLETLVRVQATRQPRPGASLVADAVSESHGEDPCDRAVFEDGEQDLAVLPHLPAHGTDRLEVRNESLALPRRLQHSTERFEALLVGHSDLEFGAEAAPDVVTRPGLHPRQKFVGLG